MPSLDWNTARACSSCATERSAGAAGELARVLTMSAALVPASDAMLGTASRPAPGLLRISPPPDRISALTHTIRPS